MGLLSGTIGFKRYTVVGEHPPVPDDTLIEPLARYAFGAAAKASGDGTEVGFITTEHLFDVEPSLAKCAVGEFLYFQLRRDQNKAPADLLRSYIRMEEAAALQASGKDFLTREERRQARDNARAKADQEARRGAFRKISAYAVLMDLAEDRLLFGNSSNSVCESFAGLFELAFGLTLEGLSAGTLATRIAQQHNQLRTLEDARPSHFIAPPADHGAEGVGAKTQRHEKDFLGSEFLTWLCWRAEEESATLDLPGKGVRQASVMFDQVLELHCAYDLTGKDVIRCEGPAKAPETASALAVGKQIKKAGLLLAFGGEQFKLTVDGPAWTVSGLALPDPPEDEDQADPLARRQVRFEQVREVLNVLDRLYAAFLKHRLGSEWAGETGRIKKWIAARGRE